MLRTVKKHQILQLLQKMEGQMDQEITLSDLLCSHSVSPALPRAASVKQDELQCVLCLSTSFRLQEIT